MKRTCEIRKSRLVLTLACSVGVSALLGCDSASVEKNVNRSAETSKESSDLMFDQERFKMVGKHQIPRLQNPSIEPSIVRQIEDVESRFATVKPEKTADLFGELGMIAHCLESFRAATYCYSQAKANQPDDFRWYCLVGHVHRVQGESGRAIAELTEGLKRISKTQPETMPARLAAMCWLGEIQLTAGQTKSAKAWFDEVLAITPNHAFALYSLGRIAEQEDDLVTAEGYFKRALDIDPRASSIQFSLGTVYRRRGQLELATKLLESSVANRRPYGPYDPLLWAVESSLKSHRRYQFIADQNFKAQQYPQAIEFYRRALAMEATDEAISQTHCNLGSALAKINDVAGAMKHWKIAATMNPTHVETLLNLGAVTMATGQFEKSTELYRAVLTQQPEHRKARLRLAQSLQKLSQYDEALSQFERLSKQDPGNRQAWLGVVETNRQLGRHELAQQIASNHGVADADSDPVANR
ncbi:tetratricopeptide repeat protein [Stieleria sp. JC731]|uniref:tetratricopeptide repeat protein n=1 Tax=Pirellulaceae TaxID=2691357 RepID=UPI001E339B76|nr:tetratricopeptide repeat protein [Stieleria sp. JC731]MCC9599782.1 tetratricopeptide repeat protein [Stieleria sp. JC731]